MGIGQKKLIRVTFPTGVVICLTSRTDTMISVLKEIGEDQFPLIDVRWKHLPLVSRYPYLRYEKWMKQISPGWYLNTKSTPAEKYQQLKEIGEDLNLDINVEFDVGFEPQDYVEKKVLKGNLLVKMPDGEYIGNESAIDTFIEVIWKLGTDDIMRKGITWNDCQFITRNKLYKNQLQIDKDRWIIVPQLNRDKIKLLRVIGAMLHLKIEATLI